MKKIYSNLVLTGVILITSVFISLVSDIIGGKELQAQTQVNFVMTMSDGTRLDCSKFTPTGTPPAGGWPAIIFCHGYGLTKEDVITEAEDAAGNGYFTMCYTMRGQGFSTGLSNLISTTEMNDFIAVGQYVKSQPNVNPNRVGASGASQGGTIPFMAACNGFPLRCIISDVSSPEFATSWIENNSVKMSLLWSLSYDTSIVRYNNTVKAMRNWILTDTKDKWDSIAYYMPLNRDFITKVNTSTSPILMSSVWQDKFFSTNGPLKIVYTLPYSNYKMYMGTFDAHGADADNGQDGIHTTLTDDFMDYWLKDIQNGTMADPKFTYASSKYPTITTGWTWKNYYSQTWLPDSLVAWRFFLQPNGKLYNSANVIQPDTISIFNDVKDTTLTMLEAVNREFTGTIFDIKFGKKTLTFDSPAMTRTCRMIGVPKVNLHYMSNADKVQFNVQIWGVPQSGTAKLISRANYTVRNNVPNTLRQLTFDGMAYSHEFAVNEKIRIIVTNLDNIPADPFLRTNPHVLPSLKKAKNTIYMSIANPSYVELPMISYAVGINNISTTVPAGYSLSQNYPNPFNPVTKIKFQIKETKEMKLSVYDITGKEVATLVNQKLAPGTYEYTWDAGKYSSGIYFYRLQTDNFSETKKMILVK